jgi:hypothetical protein
MRTIAVVAFLLLAGCSAAPDQPTPAPSTDAPVQTETLATHDVDAIILSPVSYCAPAGGCVGAFGSDTEAFAGQTWVAFDVEVAPNDFPGDQALAASSQIRVLALCLGERLTCPQEPLASAEGSFPIHLVGSGFRIVDPDALAFRVEYLGPLPLEGSGASYRLTGSLVSAGLPAAADE